MGCRAPNRERRPVCAGTAPEIDRGPEGRRWWRPTGLCAAVDLMKTGFWKFVDEIAARSEFRPGLSFWKEIWPSIAGDELARRSSPCGWHGSTLIVEVEKGAWRKAIESSRRTLMYRLSQMPWEVSDLRFEDGHVDLGGAAPAAQPRNLEAVDLPQQAQEILEEDGLDPDIAALAAKIRRHLEWEKKSHDSVDTDPDQR